MGLFKQITDSHFIRSPRYLSVDCDEFETPSYAQFFKRPEFLTAALYLGVVGATGDKEPTSLSLAGFPVTLIAAHVLNTEKREATRRRFNSLSHTKAIDTQPNEFSAKTDPKDLKIAGQERNKSLDWGSFYTAAAAGSFYYEPFSSMSPDANLALGVLITSNAAYELHKAYVMNRITNGNWVIERKRTKLEWDPEDMLKKMRLAPPEPQAV